MGITRYRDYRIHNPFFKEQLTNTRNDAGPLRSNSWLLHLCPRHAEVWAEKDLIGFNQIARATMHCGFETGIVRLNKLAGGTAALRITAARYAAVSA